MVVNFSNNPLPFESRKNIKTESVQKCISISSSFIKVFFFKRYHIFPNFFVSLKKHRKKYLPLPVILKLNLPDS